MSKFADTSQDYKESAGVEAWTQILQIANITSTQTEYLLEKDKIQKDMGKGKTAENHSAAQGGNKLASPTEQQQENLHSPHQQQQIHSSLQPSLFFDGPFPFGCIRVPFGGTPGDEFDHKNANLENDNQGTELELTSNNFKSTATTSFSVPASLDRIDRSEKQEDSKLDNDNNLENRQNGNPSIPKSSKKCQTLRRYSLAASRKSPNFGSAATTCQGICMIPKSSSIPTIQGPERMLYFSQFLLPAEFASSDVCASSNRRNESDAAASDQNPMMKNENGECLDLLKMNPFVSRFELAELNCRILSQQQQPSSDSELILPRSASQTSNVPIALQQIGGGEPPAPKQKLSPPPPLTTESSNLWIEDEPSPLLHQHFNTDANGMNRQFLQTSPNDYYQNESGEIDGRRSKDVAGEKGFGNQGAEADAEYGSGNQQLSARNGYGTINAAIFDVDAPSLSLVDPSLQNRTFRRRYQFPSYSPAAGVATNNNTTCPNNNKHPLSKPKNLKTCIKSTLENAQHCKTAEKYSNENHVSLQRASDFSIGFPDQDAVPDLASRSKENVTGVDSNSSDKKDSFSQLTAIKPSTIYSSSFPTAIEPMQTIDSSSVHGSSSNNNSIIMHQGSSDNTKKPKNETTEAKKAKKSVYYLYSTESNSSSNHYYFPMANGGNVVGDLEEAKRDWGIKELEPVDEQSSSGRAAAFQSIDSDGKKARRRSTEVENRCGKSSLGSGREAAWWGIADVFANESVLESEGRGTLLATAAETSTDRRQIQILLLGSKDSEDDTSFQPILSVHHTRSPIRRHEEQTKSAVNEPRPHPGGISNELSIGRPPLLSEYCHEDLESEYTLSSASSSTPGAHNIDNNDGKEGGQTLRKSVIRRIWPTPQFESLPSPTILLSEYCYKDLETEYSVHQLES